MYKHVPAAGVTLGVSTPRWDGKVHFHAALRERCVRNEQQRAAIGDQPRF